MDFEDIYKTYWDKIFRLCMGYVNNAELAQDLAQETFIRIWQQLPTFRNESALGTWIFRIASNNCLRQIEKDRRFVKGEFPQHLKEEEPSTLEPQIQLLYQCISSLPDMERVIISLDLEGINQAEIAEIVGLSEGNIRVKIHRIKSKLTEKFKQHGL